ncbi:S-layer homology domain-containing protein [Caldanaerobius polysaccharolyticus]|uniref:S-layer homology domain-containing protein n=1 Tax=Caldanaerobius polysaccharolyticus TaxID=44256 RepID=UPI00047A70BC|nr:S-layer homology domain-containing protein [Caldanaerobius polysaccharolyticus]
MCNRKNYIICLFISALLLLTFLPVNTAYAVQKKLVKAHDGVKLYEVIDNPNDFFPSGWEIKVKGFTIKEGGYVDVDFDLNDVNGDGRSDLIVYLCSGGSSGATDLRIYDISKLSPKIIFNENNLMDYDKYNFEVNYVGGFKVSIYNPVMDKTYEIQLNPDNYKDYQYLSQIDTWLDPVYNYLVKDIDNDGKMEINAEQRFCGVAHADTIAILSTIYKLQDNEYKPFKIYLRDLSGDTYDITSDFVKIHSSTPSPWAKKAVDAFNLYNLAEPLFMDDYQNYINREELAMLIVKTYEKIKESFIEIPVGLAYYPYYDNYDEMYKDYIIKVSYLGIMNGYDNNRFGACEPVTREQMVVTIVRMLKLLYPDEDYDNVPNIAFKDGNKISSWAKKDIMYAYKVGIIKGSGSIIAPQSYATREQAITVLYRLLIDKGIIN